MRPQRRRLHRHVAGRPTAKRDLDVAAPAATRSSRPGCRSGSEGRPSDATRRTPRSACGAKYLAVDTAPDRQAAALPRPDRRASYRRNPASPARRTREAPSAASPALVRRIPAGVRSNNLRPTPVLEALHPRRQSRRGHVQRGGRLDERARVDDRLQGLDLPEGQAAHANHPFNFFEGSPKNKSVSFVL